LSIAAHLRKYGVDFRIFGSPMKTWLSHMPKGMHLKSEGFASSLYDPDSIFTLADYCKEKGLPYADIGTPVPLETFSAYGLEFQKRFVPTLEDQWVTSLRKSAGGFQVTLGNGEVFGARRIVVAVGLAYFEYVPQVLADLPPTFMTHASRQGQGSRRCRRRRFCARLGCAAASEWRHGAGVGPRQGNPLPRPTGDYSSHLDRSAAFAGHRNRAGLEAVPVHGGSAAVPPDA
jgi:hypothetical protein